MAYSKNLIGSNIKELQSVDSTNNYAAKLLDKTKVQNGTVILAHVQTAGRGQRGRSWSSSDQDLTFSVVLYPEGLSTAKQFYLSRAISLGIKDYLEGLVQGKVSIKWPNDIFINDMKVGGMLIENELQGDLISKSIIGIGLNVDLDLPQVDFMHTSIRSETRGAVDKMDLFDGLLGALNKRYQELCNGKWVRLLRDHTNALYLKGCWTEFDLRGKVVKARALDVEEDGRLTIELEHGGTVSEGLGQLRHILYGTDIPQ